MVDFSVSPSVCRIAVSTKEDARSKTLFKRLQKSGFTALKQLQLNDVYTVSSELSETELHQTTELLHNPVIQKTAITRPLASASFDWVFEIGFLPGVTDNVGKTASETIGDFFREKAAKLEVFSSQEFFVSGKFSENKIKQIAESLANPLIQRVHIKNREKFLKDNGMDAVVPRVLLNQEPEAKETDLNVSDGELAKIGKEGILDFVDSTGKEIRRGPLALDLESMKTIQAFFKKEGRNPTDVELESIAQTWSEHCKHTIFAAELDEIKGGLFKEKIKKSTQEIRQKKGKNDWCVSVFVDNAGGIKFDENWIVADKVETHNSPSALDPFGGAITGIVGVNRDAIGFGMGAKPVINRYGFCFGEPNDLKQLFREKNRQSAVLLPHRIMQGVIDGVKVGGNCSGIPTPQGFLYFDERYKGKPLVFVGTVGLLPQQINGKPGHEKKAMPGDAIVMVGGRVGMDGIHGATFSSEAMTANSPATAVQIGDPITQKKMSDAIVKEARDLGLYNSITDNGAGGLSCSVAEMAKESNGCRVELDAVPLKYPNLEPWKTWVSESQERMTLAVPKEKVKAFVGLMQKRGVEATVIGEFTNSGKCEVFFKKQTVMDIPLDFLHEGLPKKQLKTKPFPHETQSETIPEPSDYNSLLCEMLSRYNIASTEFVSTQFDHEVQGGSVLKPLQGIGRIQANATVVKPVLSSEKGVAVSQALFPRYGDLDCYWMASTAIETALRNLVAVGTKRSDIVLLDNFCWCSSNEPERLHQLKQAVQACYDFSIGFGTPFVSGKDSMFNDFKGFDEKGNPIKISVPPTLLISSFGIVQQAEKCVSLDAKFEGDSVFVLGETKNELGAGEYLSHLGEKNGNKRLVGKNVPKVELKESIAVMNAVEQLVERELVASIQPTGLGGLGIALAKTCIGGKLGCKIDLCRIPHVKEAARNDALLFSESVGRFVITANPQNEKEIETILKGIPFAKIGSIQKEKFEISGLENKKIVSTSIFDLERAYKKTFEGF